MAGYGYPSDHLCRPVIIDAEGRKRPIIDYGPNHSSEGYVTARDSSEGYVTARVQRIVEHVHQPVVVSQYKHRSHVSVRPLVEDYNEIDDDAGDQSWSRRPSSPVYDRPQVVGVPEYGYNFPLKSAPLKNYGAPGSPGVRDHPQVVVPEYRYDSPKKVEPVKSYGATNDKYGRPSSPVRDRPQVVVPEYREPVKISYPAAHNPVNRDYQKVGYNSPNRVEPAKYYETNNDNYRPQVLVPEYRSPEEEEPLKDSEAPKVEEFLTKIQTEVSRPTRPGFLSAAAWRKLPNPTAQGDTTGYGSEYKPASGNSIPINNGPPQPIITNRDEQERPAWTNVASSYNTKPTNGNSISINNGSTEPIITNRDGQERPAWTSVAPSYNTKPASDNFIPNNNGSTEPRPAWTSVVPSYNTKPATGHSIPNNNGSTDPTITNKDGRERPAWNGVAPSYNTKPVGGNFIPNNNGSTEPTITNRDGWERPDWNGTGVSSTRPTPLSGPTNNIEHATEILKAAVKSLESAPYTVPVASQTRFGTAPASGIPKRDAAYTETIDSREAARRYNNLNSSSRPVQEQGRYTGTITSKEAAQKYKGAIV